MHLRLLLLSALALCSCDRREEISVPIPAPAPSPALPATLPLSPGFQIASITSGGIAGIFESVQVSDGWQLIVANDLASGKPSYIRHVKADEQASIRAALKGFATLRVESGGGEADSFSSITVARGWGEGEGDSEDAAALRQALAEALAAGPDE